MSLDAWTAATTALASLTRASLEAWQLARLNETIAFAKDASPFYRRGALPKAALAELSDLAGLPLTTAEDLIRADPPLVAVSQGDIARVVTLPTSGTTGLPKRLHFTDHDVEAIVDFFAAGMGQFTRAGDCVVIAFPGERPGSIGALLVTAIERLGARPVLVPWALPPEQLGRIIEAERADVVAGPPVRLLAAARCHRPTSARVRAVLVSSDRLPSPLADALTAFWGAEVFDHWGMTETGLGGAVDCAAHDGMHLRVPDILAEVIDPATGRPCAEDEAGELVISTLRRRGLPLLRYRTGDAARIIHAPCRCGSILPRLRIGGRIGAGVSLAKRQLTLGDLDDALFADDDVTDFLASWQPGEKARLDIAIASPAAGRSVRTLARCRDRLANVPALRRELDENRLAIALSQAPSSLCDHGGKRRLRTGG